MNTGERIKTLRIHRGLTLDDVASSVGTIKQTIYKYEHGVVTNIPDDKVNLLAKALDTTSAYLRCLVDDPDPSLNYNELVKKHIQMKKTILEETKDALDRETVSRKDADKRLLDVAHKICLTTPERGITYPDGEKVVGPLNAMRMDAITDFVKDNEKSLRAILNAADEATEDTDDGVAENSFSVDGK